jgi:hypothetical protein
MMVSCFGRDFDDKRVLMHAEIAKTQPPSSVQVVEIGQERNHERASLANGMPGAAYTDQTPSRDSRRRVPVLLEHFHIAPRSC